jgi:hypothetical protein
MFGHEFAQRGPARPSGKGRLEARYNFGKRINEVGRSWDVWVCVNSEMFRIWAEFRIQRLAFLTLSRARKF